MEIALSASEADRRDIARAEAIMESLRRDLDDWYEVSHGRVGLREEPLDVRRLHRQARELANVGGGRASAADPGRAESGSRWKEEGRRPYRRCIPYAC